MGWTSRSECLLKNVSNSGANFPLNRKKTSEIDSTDFFHYRPKSKKTFGSVTGSLKNYPWKSAGLWENAGRGCPCRNGKEWFAGSLPGNPWNHLVSNLFVFVVVQTGFFNSLQTCSDKHYQFLYWDVFQKSRHCSTWYRCSSSTHSGHSALCENSEYRSYFGQLAGLHVGR